MKDKVTLRDIINYIVGNIRFKLYYSRYRWLIRRHIVEQISYRIRIMNPRCLEDGSCVECGCEIPALQMIHKSCEGLCYPPLTNKDTWDKKDAIKDMENMWLWDRKRDRYALFVETATGYDRCPMKIYKK